MPKGTRDFLPSEMVKRNYIFDTIKSVYQRFGYLPIETPAMENLDTLMGKYGEEGDRLIFKILNSGDFLSSVDKENLQNLTSLSVANKICEKALRYDLTVPFARFVVQYRNDITFPFKRFQIQPVWRADRPQKGRYREFYQCDADVVGSDSLLNEVELVQIIDSVFRKLQVRVCIKINNRKILSGIAELIGQADKIVDITVAIDKLDKIGLEKVNEELLSKGIPTEAINTLQPIILLSGTNQEKLEKLEQLLVNSEVGMKGIEELKTVFEYLQELEIKCEFEFDLTLARGLNYYTGAIFEVKSLDVQIGSICGGGRYDNLTGIFGMPDVSGVGISFGADRIYDVLNTLDNYPADSYKTTKILFANFGKAEEKYCMRLLSQIREAGINAEIYPSAEKMKKQMSYADARKIKFVALIGESEMTSNMLTIKNMITGEQLSLNAQDMLKLLLED
ncbi:MAG: histidine--tRNA ligase [Bacteroidales bacterium]|nr:histidine--tRNA ligase [Bacteroidales bacterium]